jgi:SHS2 domain-containing protein
MPYHLIGQASGLRVEVSAPTLPRLMEEAAQAFTTAIAPLDTVEPRLAEELDIDAPDLESLLVDFLSDLLYRFDTRGWLTRFAEIEVHQTEDGWTLESTLRGERRERPDAPVGGVSYEGLVIAAVDDAWTAAITLVGKPAAGRS